MTQKILLQFNGVKNRTSENVSRIQRAVFFEISNRVIDMTPVDTGRARANWQAEVGGFSEGDVDSTNAIVASNSVSSAISAHRKGLSLNLGNNLEYIGFLNNGSSQQAPAGMVDVAIADFASLVEVEARAL